MEKRAPQHIPEGLESIAEDGFPANGIATGPEDGLEMRQASGDGEMRRRNTSGLCAASRLREKKLQTELNRIFINNAQPGFFFFFSVDSILYFLHKSIVFCVQ